MLLLSSVDFTCFFCCQTSRKNTSVSNGLDPDQDGHSVGLDLGPNCLQRLSADDKSPQAIIYFSSNAKEWSIDACTKT